ncbi:LacI family DNA-binding transcriptional regulator [Agromyces tropicus]|uniref:LacI family DNA-binding transcriptional regulator n=1 Tax=Agromyces tropicus TaxID=555371 RepID=A0ABP5FI97_9MICO
MAVTRNDVARAAGVSPAVVSYVLNDGPRPVSAGARARVLTAIDELGYKPDGVARYLRTGKTKSVGLVLPDLGLPYFSEFTKAISAAAYRIDHQLLIANTDWALEQERRQIAALVERRVDAMVFMSVDPSQDFASLAELGIPVVVIDRPDVAVRSAAVATEHFITVHGHENIAIVTNDLLPVVSRRRMQGWADELARHGLTTEGRSFGAPPSRAGGFEAAMRMLRQRDRPTAVFVEADAQAIGMIRAAVDLRIGVPGDLAVISSEGTELAEFAVPRLSTIQQPIARLAAGALDLALAGGPPGLRRLTDDEFHLVLRESCGCNAQEAARA